MEWELYKDFIKNDYIIVMNFCCQWYSIFVGGWSLLSNIIYNYMLLTYIDIRLYLPAS